MKTLTRILLGCGIAFAVVSLFLIGYTTSDASCSTVTPATYIRIWPILVLYIAYIVSALWFFKRATLGVTILALLVSLCFCFFALGFWNSGRCMPPDFRVRQEIKSYQPHLSEIKETQGVYPDNLDNVVGLPILTPSLIYQRINDSYEFCAYFRNAYFFGFQVTQGTRMCFGPNDKP